MLISSLGGELFSEEGTQVQVAGNSLSIRLIAIKCLPVEVPLKTWWVWSEPWVLQIFTRV